MPSPSRSSLFLLALFACTPAEQSPAWLVGQAPVPCTGCAIVGAPDLDNDGDGACEDTTRCADGSLPRDCNDGAADVHPGAQELADTVDRDCDGVPGLEDQCVGTDAAGDADADGACDDLDACPMVPDLGADADLDGLPDACDPCPGLAGADQTDLDLDGLCDQAPSDLCFGPDGLGDLEGDGQCDVPHTLLSYDGSQGNDARDALEPSIAFSITSQRYLVVWSSDIDVEGQADNTYDLWSRVLDAEGRPLTPPWRLTRQGASARRPAVAWNSAEDSFLVVFDESVPADHEIYGLLVGPDGLPRGPKTRLTGFEGATGEWTAVHPALSYDPNANSFLVVMSGTRYMEERTVDAWTYAYTDWFPEQEIFSRRVDAEGQPLGHDELRISTIGTADSGDRDADWPSIAHDPVRQRFLIAYQGDHVGDNLFEVYATLLGPDDEILVPRIAVSSMGTSPWAYNFQPARAEVAFSETSEVYLVVWYGDDDSGGLVDGEFEVYGRVIDAHGVPVGAQFRISRTGADGNPTADATDPAVVWHASTDSFVVEWRANPGTGGLSARDGELFRQIVSPAGVLLLPAEQQLTTVHAGGALALGPVGQPAMAYNPLLHEVRTVYGAEDPAWGGSFGEQGIWTVAPSPSGLDADNDGVRDELDRCPGPDDLDGDGRVACLSGHPLADCDDGDPLLGADADLDGLCDPLDPCPFDPGNDLDGDGSCANADLCLGDNTTGDPDADGVCTGSDPCPLSPLDDADGDGVCEDIDLCLGADATGDSDGDAVCDDRDLCPTADTEDADLDGMPDGCDTCPLVYNARSPGDSDGDGPGDACDVCPYSSNLLQADHDGDGVCDLDAADLCFGPDHAGDSDGDGVCDTPQLLVGLHDGPLDPEARDNEPAVVFNEVNQRFLAVWNSNTDLDRATSDAREIWGRLLDLRGVPVAAPVQLTDWRGDRSNDRTLAPSLSANLADGSYLMAYEAARGGERAVFVRRIESTGLPVVPSQQVARRGPPGADDLNAAAPDVVYNPAANEHLVVFEGTTFTGARASRQVFGRRVDALGRLLGAAERRISATGDASALDPAVAHGAASDRYVVVYKTDADRNDAYEIDAILVDPLGVPLGPPTRVSRMGASAVDDDFAALAPDIAYSVTSDVFLVVWYGDDDQQGLPDGKYEVYGRLLDGQGQPVGNQLRISRTGSAQDSNADASRAVVTWDASLDSFTVMWEATPGTAPYGLFESELFVQRVSPTGARLLPTEERATFVGPDGSNDHGPFETAIAYEPLLGGTLFLFSAYDDPWFQPGAGADSGTGIWSRIWGAAPLADADGDGVRDELDLCVGPDDLDGDGRAGCLLGDPFGDCDDLDHAVAADADADGQCDRDDPCLGTQALGDADLDGVCNDLDRCVGDDTQDRDHDGVPDACDTCPDDSYNDADLDGLCGDVDLCLGHNGGGDADGDGTCDVSLALLDPFLPGSQTRIRSWTLPAGVRATLLASPSATLGAEACHPASPAACTTLTQRIVIGATVANSAGEARWLVPVPASVPSGREFLMQAVWWDPATGNGGSSEVITVMTP